jgi:ribosomal protein S27E
MGLPDRDIAQAEGFIAPPGYRRHQPETTLLYQLVAEHGFLRVKCESCHPEKLVAFSCKRRGFCPSCGARRMAETAALLVDDVLPRQPVRQWVLSLPFALRYPLATRPEVVTQVLGIA